MKNCNRFKKLYWVITDRCNLGCRYCYYHSGLRDKNGQDAKIEDNSLLKKIADHFQEVVLTGGEPLLYPHLNQVIAFLKRKGLKVAILTNGTLLNQKVFKSLVDLGLDELCVSLDSLDEEINDYQRGQTNLILQNLKNLLKKRPKFMAIEIMQTVTKRNLPSIIPLVNFSVRNNLGLWLDPVDISPQKRKTLANLSLLNLDNKERKLLEEAMKYWTEKFNKQKELASYADNCLSLIDKKRPKNIFCPMGTFNLVMEPNGDVYPCFLREDLPLGNLLRDNSEEIFKKAFKHQKELQKAICARLGCICMTMTNTEALFSK